MKKFYRVLLALMDDFLFICGAACVTAAAYCVDYRAGMAVLGVFLIAYSVIVARSKR